MKYFILLLLTGCSLIEQDPDLVAEVNRAQQENPETGIPHLFYIIHKF